MIFGYLLWVFISKIVTPDIIGISSTVVSLTLIFSSIVDVGVSTGSMRFLGKSFSERQTGDTRVLITASFLIIFFAILLCSLTILVFKDWIYPNIEFDLILVSIFLMGIFVVFSLLRSILIASLETKSLPKIMLVSSICRIIMTVILVLLGTGAVGITIGYSLAYVSAVVLLSFTLGTMLMPIKKGSTFNLYYACKSIFVASVPTWISQVIGVVGTSLGTIIVFGSIGAGHAGSYFIATSIFYAIASIRNSLLDIAFPILSGMDDQRKRFVWKLIKMSLVISLPITSTVILYSDEVMGLIGPYYVQGSMSLIIISLSMFPSTLSMGIGTLVYSYGNYWKVLALGLGANVSRILFYFVLVPLYGNTGAATSFTLGSIVGFVVSIMVAKKIGLRIFWKELGLIFIIPTGLVLISEYFHVHYMMGIPIVLIISIILYSRLGILSKSDIRDYLGVLPRSIGNPLINIVNKL